ncbi:hypothetical protein ABZ783_20450 [Micromonospora sp. NPDC047738]|uniref:hypothetical protein n=1 Tax=Micromonospora sp. NPDC047738 TaxID=3155741 RepID=UPI0033E754EE
MRVVTRAAERLLSLVAPRMTAEAGCISLGTYCLCTATCVNYCCTTYDNCPTRCVCR